jgi:hypothetical protein
MVNSRTMISQVQEFNLILHDIHIKGMDLGESFQVNIIIKKITTVLKRFQELPYL